MTLKEKETGEPTNPPYPPSVNERCPVNSGKTEARKKEKGQELSRKTLAVSLA
jgi:hypothetical protein